MLTISNYTYDNFGNIIAHRLELEKKYIKNCGKVVTYVLSKEELAKYR
jgi:predicted KAP-like P-loop ATPase